MKNSARMRLSENVLQELGNPREYKLLKKALLLPDSYEIERVQYPSHDMPYIEITVRSEDIPFSAFGTGEIVPQYRKNDDGTVELVSIDFINHV